MTELSGSSQEVSMAAPPPGFLLGACIYWTDIITGDYRVFTLCVCH